MKRFQRVLVYLETGDCDPASGTAISDLVRRNGATLTLLSSVDESSRLGRLWPGSDDADDDAENEIADRLTATAATFDVDASTDVDRGIPAISIVRRVLRGEADLVITVDGESPPSPNTRRLLRKCPCPVWVIRPDAASERRAGLSVVAAVDPAPEDVELNLLILQLASSMVERAGGTLHVVNAWEMIGSTSRPGRHQAGRFDVTYDELMIQARSHRADALDRLLQRLGPYDIERTTHLVHGRPESAIPEVLDEVTADVLVMGTVARTGIRGLVIGNTAERVLTSAECSLMAVKPADFVSPIGETD